MEIIVLGVVAGVSFLSYALWRKARGEGLNEALVEARTQARLAGAEPTLAELRPGDVVSHLRTDYLVEAGLAFDDDGRTTRLFRLADGARVRWLAVRPAGTTVEDPLLLDEVGEAEVPVTVSAPDQLVVGGAPYRLASRASAKVTVVGTTPRPPGERAQLYEYRGVGTRRLLAAAWGDQQLAWAGEPVEPGLLEILPGGA